MEEGRGGRGGREGRREGREGGREGGREEGGRGGRREGGREGGRGRGGRELRKKGRGGTHSVKIEDSIKRLGNESEVDASIQIICAYYTAIETL